MFICKLKIFSQNVNNLCWDNWQRSQRTQSFGFYFKLFISEDSLMSHFYTHPGERELWPSILGRESCDQRQLFISYLLHNSKFIDVCILFCFVRFFLLFLPSLNRKSFFHFPQWERQHICQKKKKSRTGKHPSEKGRNDRKENNKTHQECLWYCPSISGTKALNTERAEERWHKTKGTISLVTVLISVPLVLKDLGHRE